MTLTSADDAPAHLEDAWLISPWRANEHVLVLHGGVSNLDHAAEHFAERRGCSAAVMTGKVSHQSSAPESLHTTQMIDVCDGVVAIWDGLCADTRRLIAEATGLGKPVHVHRVSAARAAT